MKNIDSLLKIMQEIFPDKNCNSENLDDFLQLLAIVDIQQSQSNFTSDQPSHGKEERTYAPETIMPKPSPKDLKSEPYITFKKMRQMGRIYEDLRDCINYYGGDTKTFCKQAQFMEDFTDNFDPVIPFDDPYATYDQMTDSQLRTYFTWRTKVRQGIIENVPVSYIFCYAYELLNDVGITNAAECIEKLIALWTDFRQYTDQLDCIMPTWIRDYYVEHRLQLSADFSQYSNQFPLPYCYIDMEMVKKIKSCAWDDLYVIEESSSFKITNGTFFKTGDQKIIEHCVCFIIQKLAKIFKSEGADLRNLFFENCRHKIFNLYPNAAHPVVTPFPITVELNAYETIHGKNCGWYVTYTDHLKYRPVMGYILKLVEIKMRQHFGYHSKLQPPKLSIVENCFLNSEPGKYCSSKQTIDKLKMWKRKTFAIISSPHFEEIIACAISDYCKTAHIVTQNSIVKVIKLKSIEIDMNKIKDIEKDHIETAKKLIVAEPFPAEKELIEVHSNTVSNLVSNVSDPEKTETATGTAALVASLSAESKDLLRLIAEGQAPPNSELLIDTINEKALETISDNLIDYMDGKPYIYDDYMNELKLSLGGN